MRSAVLTVCRFTRVNVIAVIIVYVDWHPSCLQIFDKDGKGWITSAELRHVLSNLGEKLSPAEMDDMIKESDPDDDGKIQQEEFVRMLTAR